jgi:hypothetical protein
VFSHSQQPLRKMTDISRFVQYIALGIGYFSLSNIKARKLAAGSALSLGNKTESSSRIFQSNATERGTVADASKKRHDLGATALVLDRSPICIGRKPVRFSPPVLKLLIPRDLLKIILAVFAATAVSAASALNALELPAQFAQESAGDLFLSLYAAGENSAVCEAKLTAFVAELDMMLDSRPPSIDPFLVLINIPVLYNFTSGLFTEQAVKSELATVIAQNSAMQDVMQQIFGNVPIGQP